MYFHAIVTNRKKYGIIGFNVPYNFEFSDFEVCCSQLTEIMKPANPDDMVNNKAVLDTLRYFWANINYAGKI